MSSVTLVTSVGLTHITVGFSFFHSFSTRFFTLLFGLPTIHGTYIMAVQFVVLLQCWLLLVPIAASLAVMNQFYSALQLELTRRIFSHNLCSSVLTRKNSDTSYTNLVRLLIIDEIHLLHDECGPVLKSIVTQTIWCMKQTSDYVRLVGLSATLPSYEDVHMPVSVLRSTSNMPNHSPQALTTQACEEVPKQTLCRITATHGKSHTLVGWEQAKLTRIIWQIITSLLLLYSSLMSSSVETMSASTSPCFDWLSHSVVPSPQDVRPMPMPMPPCCSSPLAQVELSSNRFPSCMRRHTPQRARAVQYNSSSIKEHSIMPEHKIKTNFPRLHGLVHAMVACMCSGILYVFGYTHWPCHVHTFISSPFQMRAFFLPRLHTPYHLPFLFSLLNGDASMGIFAAT